MSEYPRDEFDDVPETSERIGVHRERIVKPRGSLVVLIATVIGLAVVLGLIAWLVLPKLGLGNTNASEPTAQESVSAPATPSPTPTQSQKEETDSSEPAEPSEEPKGTVNKQVPLGVYNATFNQGMGQRVANQLGADGWIVTAVTNWQGAPVNGSIVYYPREDLQATAEAVGALLGIPNVVLDPNFGDTIGVVAGPGYQG